MRSLGAGHADPYTSLPDEWRDTNGDLLPAGSLEESYDTKVSLKDLCE